MSILDPRSLNGIVGSCTLPDVGWLRMQAAYGVAGQTPNVMLIPPRNRQFALEAMSFQHHPGNGTRRTSAAAAKSAALADELKATPDLIVDKVDQQIVNPLALGSFRAVTASLIGIG